MPQLGLPNWLRRSFEAAIAAGLVAIVSLVGGRLSAPPEIVTVPRGISGVLLLAPSVLALGVIPVAWPTGMAATRSDALFGALAGWLIAADATVLFATGRVRLEGTGLELPAGFLTLTAGVSMSDAARTPATFYDQAEQALAYAGDAGIALRIYSAEVADRAGRAYRGSAAA